MLEKLFNFFRPFKATSVTEQASPVQDTAPPPPPPPPPISIPLSVEPVAPKTTKAVKAVKVAKNTKKTTQPKAAIKTDLPLKTIKSAVGRKK